MRAGRCNPHYLKGGEHVACGLQFFHKSDAPWTGAATTQRDPVLCPIREVTEGETSGMVREEQRSAITALRRLFVIGSGGSPAMQTHRPPRWGWRAGC